MIFIYAVVFCQKKQEILVFKKKRNGFFFQKNIPKNLNGKYKIEPMRLNGGGKHCFPGGSRKSDETDEEGARREFLEETGVLLDSTTHKLDYGKYKGIVFFCDENEFDRIASSAYANIIKKENELEFVFNLCHPFTKVLEEVKKVIDTTTALTHNGKKIFDAWNRLISGSILDDELYSVKRISLDIYPLYFQQGCSSTGWFFNICKSIVENYPSQSKSSKKEW